MEGVDEGTDGLGVVMIEVEVVEKGVQCPEDEGGVCDGKADEVHIRRWDAFRGVGADVAGDELVRGIVRLEDGADTGCVGGPRDGGFEDDGADHADAPPAFHDIGVGAEQVVEREKAQDGDVRNGGAGALGVGGGGVAVSVCALVGEDVTDELVAGCFFLGGVEFRVAGRRWRNGAWGRFAVAAWCALSGRVVCGRFHGRFRRVVCGVTLIELVAGVEERNVLGVG